MRSGVALQHLALVGDLALQGEGGVTPPLPIRLVETDEVEELVRRVIEDEHVVRDIHVPVPVDVLRAHDLAVQFQGTADIHLHMIQNPAPSPRSRSRSRPRPDLDPVAPRLRRVRSELRPLRPPGPPPDPRSIPARCRIAPHAAPTPRSLAARHRRLGRPPRRPAPLCRAFGRDGARRGIADHRAERLRKDDGASHRVRAAAARGGPGPLRGAGSYPSPRAIPDGGARSPLSDTAKHSRMRLLPLRTCASPRQCVAAGRRSALEEALERVGLEQERDTLTRELSAGQRRRAALARLLLDDPVLWVLDEPSAALDRAGAALVESMCSEHAAAGGAIVFTSHQPLHLAHGRVRELRLGPG